MLPLVQLQLLWALWSCERRIWLSYLSSTQRMWDKSRKKLALIFYFRCLFLFLFRSLTWALASLCLLPPSLPAFFCSASYNLYLLIVFFSLLPFFLFSTFYRWPYHPYLLSLFFSRLLSHFPSSHSSSLSTPPPPLFRFEDPLTSSLHYTGSGVGPSTCDLMLQFAGLLLVHTVRSLPCCNTAGAF